MNYRRRGGNLLGLLVVAIFAAMAFAGSAEGVAPLFNVGGVTGGEFQVSGKQEGSGSLSIPPWNVSLTCAEFETAEGAVLAGGEAAHFKLLYKGCKAFEYKEPTTELPCHVSDVAGGNPNLLHITVGFLALPVEFADGKYGVLVEKLQLQINFLAGTGCFLPLKTLIRGEFCLRITSGNDTTEALIKSNKTIQTECPLRSLLEVVLKKEHELAKNNELPPATIEDSVPFGAVSAFIEGQATFFGTGSAAGNAIGVLLL